MSEIPRDYNGLSEERRARIIEHLSSVHSVLIEAMSLPEIRAYTSGGPSVNGLARMARDVDALRASVRGHERGLPAMLLVPLPDATGEEAARSLLEQKMDSSLLLQMCAALCERKKHTQKLGISMMRLYEWLELTSIDELEAALERLALVGHVSLTKIEVDDEQDTVVKVSDGAIHAYLQRQRAVRYP